MHMMHDKPHEEILSKHYLQIKQINNQANLENEFHSRPSNQSRDEIMQIFIQILNQIMDIELQLSKMIVDNDMY